MADELYIEDSREQVATLPPMRAPFPYFGGKSRAAHLIWPRFGHVPNYVEPFFGSGATLLARPHPPGIETVNDLNAMVANFWRSLVFAPEIVADFADWPVNEADLHARHNWLVQQEEFKRRMLIDPDYYDPKIAGWWVWGQSASLRTNFAITEGDEAFARSIPNLGQQGINNQRIRSIGIQEEFTRLAKRLRRVRVVCGDWSRVVSPSNLQGQTAAVLLDPPYFDGLSDGLYANNDANISAAVRQWAIENGSNPNYRIALCGYEGEHQLPDSWECVSWKAAGGFGGQRADGSNQNAERERIWFSPACLKVTDSLFYDSEDDE